MLKAMQERNLCSQGRPSPIVLRVNCLENANSSPWLGNSFRSPSGSWGLPLFLLAIVKYGSLPVSRLLFVPFDTKTGAKINCHIKLPCIDLG